MRRLFLFSAVSVIGCGIPVGGTIEVRGDPNDSNFYVEPRTCVTGDRKGDFGVELGDASGTTLEFRHGGPEPPTVRITAPGYWHTDTLLIEPSDCAVFDGTLERGDEFKHGARTMRGDLTLDCTLPSGDRVIGFAVFDECSSKKRGSD
ncbi:MAG: hypothetical protein AAF721_11030 [Myxococcota bacterium]